MYYEIKSEQSLDEFVKTEVHILLSPFSTVQTVSVTVLVGKVDVVADEAPPVVEETSLAP